jgi:TDG/mug DNA glycosylase family protein
MDAELPGNSFDAARLRQVIETIQPRAFAFNGKKAGSAFYGIPTGQLSYGRQPECIGETAFYVLPSTAAAASGYWSVEPWRALARELP